MQMRAGRTACATYFGYLLPPYYHLPQFDQALGSMSIAADEIIAMVDIDHITIFRMVIGIHYPPPGRRNDRSTCRCRKINTFMKSTPARERVYAQPKTRGVP